MIETQRSIVSQVVRHAGLYCRLSPRPDGTYEGVDAQERWGRAYAARVWPEVPVEVFADAGLSAARDDVRPGYDRFREWVRAGRLVHVWTVEQSRLERREVQWFELAAEFDAAGIVELHTDRDGIVRVRDEVAGIKAVLNAAEVRKLRRRVLDTLAEKARQGEPSGARPYGYVRATTGDGVKTLAIIEEQAAVIREAAARILAGWSLGAVAADLAARGIVAPHGGKMIGTAVRRMLVAPATAGLRVHRDQVHPGNWPSILDVETWTAVRARLDAPRTVRRSDGGVFEIAEGFQRRPRTLRRYFLTGGLSACGVCGAPLYGSVRPARLRKGETEQDRRPPVAWLLCHGTKGGRGCVGVQMESIENHVAEQLFAELDRPEFVRALSEDEHAARRAELTRELSTLDGRRSELATMWGAGSLNTDEWQAARAALDVRGQALRADLDGVPPPPVRLDVVTALRSAWPAMTLDERREVVRLFIDRVTVNRATPGAKVFEPSRVVITWARR